MNEKSHNPPVDSYNPSLMDEKSSNPLQIIQSSSQLTKTHIRRPIWTMYASHGLDPNNIFLQNMQNMKNYAVSDLTQKAQKDKT
jgi:hypothetical protein